MRKTKHQSKNLLKKDQIYNQINPEIISKQKPRKQNNHEQLNNKKIETIILRELIFIHFQFFYFLPVSKKI